MELLRETKRIKIVFHPTSSILEQSNLLHYQALKLPAAVYNVRCNAGLNNDVLFYNVVYTKMYMKLSMDHCRIPLLEVLWRGNVVTKAGKCKKQMHQF